MGHKISQKALQKALDSDEVLNNLLKFDDARMEDLTFLRISGGFYVLTDEDKEYLMRRVKDARGG